ncbi:MAG: hypothetical protein ACOWWO_03205 [Peptococcaceae bacterium]
MRRKLAIIVLFVIVVFLTTSCTKQQEEIEIYSFSGENNTITINNGLIIVTDDLEKFIGGDLTFKGEEPSDVKYSFTKFYFYKDGVETTILSNSESIEGTTKGTYISPDMGSISSKNLFYGNDLEQIKKSLNFSVSGIFMNGKNFEYNLVLDVKKAY